MALNVPATINALIEGAEDAEREGNSLSAPIKLSNIQLNDRAGGWDRDNGKAELAVYTLKSKPGQDWHEETLPTGGWFNLLRSREPVPVAHLTNCENKMVGIIHMRHGHEMAEICLSLISNKNVWQTGVWLQISRGDEVGISWCTDWQGREISTISLEILTPTQH